MSFVVITLPPPPPKHTITSVQNKIHRCVMRVQGMTVKRRDKMGIPKRPLLVGLAIVMTLGILVYFRLWIIDNKISAYDSEFLRKQFDLAHKEAMDESAEWRSRFDEERERATKCVKELSQLKESRGKMPKDMPTVDERLKRLQSENIDLLEKLRLLKQDLEAEKLKCGSQ